MEHLHKFKQFEDVWYEPDREALYKRNKIESFEKLEKFVEEWVDDNIGLESAGCGVIEKYDEIQIHIFQKKRQSRARANESFGDMRDEWRLTAESLVEDLNRWDLDFDKYWDFHVGNYTETSCWVSGEDKPIF